MIKNTFKRYLLLGAMVFGLSFAPGMMVSATAATPAEQPAASSEVTEPSGENKESTATEQPAANTPAYTITAMSGTYYATEDANVYSEPTNSASSIGTVKKETSVSVTGATSNDSSSWYQVSYNGSTGYVKQGSFTTTAPVSKPDYTVQDTAMTLYALSDTPVYTEPNTTASLIGTLKTNEAVDGTGTTVANGFSWWRVTYNGKVGYLFSNYVTSNKPVSEDVNSDVSSTENNVVTNAGYTLDTSVAGTYKTTSGIKVRSTPSTQEDNKIGVLEEGSEITVLASTSNENKYWYQIQFGNQVGYVAAEYVTTVSNTANGSDSDSDSQTLNPADDTNVITDSTETASTITPAADESPVSKKSSTSSKKTLIIVVAVILILLVIGGTAFYLLHDNGKEDDFDDFDEADDADDAYDTYDESNALEEYDENGYLIEYDADGRRIYYDDITGEPYVLTEEENAEDLSVEYDEYGNPIEYDEYGNPIEYDANGRRIYYDENGDAYVLTDEE